KSELDKIFNKGAFDPFDLSGLADKAKPEKPEKAAKKSEGLRGIIASGDGSHLSIEIAKIDFQISELREQSKGGLIKPEEFQAELAELQGLRDGFSLLNTTMESVSEFAGDVFASFLTDGVNAAENIAKAFKSMVSSIIRDLIRLAAQKAILNVLD